MLCLSVSMALHSYDGPLLPSASATDTFFLHHNICWSLLHCSHSHDSTLYFSFKKKKPFVHCHFLHAFLIDYENACYKPSNRCCQTCLFHVSLCVISSPVVMGEVQSAYEGVLTFNCYWVFSTS